MNNISEKKHKSLSSNNKFWKLVWHRFISTNTNGFWLINFPVSLAIGLKVCDACFNYNKTWDGLLKIVVVVALIAILKLLWSILVEMKRRISLWLATSFWGICIQEMNKAQKCLMISNTADMNLKKKAMYEALNRLKEIMNIITDSNCGISIKVPNNPQDDPLKWRMVTILRDSEHTERDNPKYRTTKHYVRLNTAFLSIVNELNDNNWEYIYVNNDNTCDPSYKSTSANCYPALKQYVSEIVVPILWPKASDEDILHGLRGFLCVDCDRPYPFKNVDVTSSIICMIAYQLQPILSNENNENITAYDI